MFARKRALSGKSPPSKPSVLRLSIASALAAGALFAPVTHARVVSVTRRAPTTAFGGYSWPGVGQYVKITGVAYAEVDRGDPRNAIITDIKLAQPQSGAGTPGKTA